MCRLVEFQPRRTDRSEASSEVFHRRLPREVIRPRSPLWPFESSDRRRSRWNRVSTFEFGCCCWAWPAQCRSCCLRHLGASTWKQSHIEITRLEYKFSPNQMYFAIMLLIQIKPNACSHRTSKMKTKLMYCIVLKFKTILNNQTQIKVPKNKNYRDSAASTILNHYYKSDMAKVRPAGRMRPSKLFLRPLSIFCSCYYFYYLTF